MAFSAAATLASTLLDSEREHQKFPSARTFSAGIKTLDHSLSSNLWAGEKLIGVVSEGKPQLTERIIIEHLLSFHARIVQDGESANCFVIAPHTSSIITSIHSSISDHLSHLPGPQAQLTAVQYLGNVQVLQFFDFAGLTESVAEVSARLFDMSTSVATQKTVLYLEGIGVAIESCQRRSGVVQANSLLSSLMRTLTHLSRTCPCLLIMLDLALRRDLTGDEAIPCAFASASGSSLGYQPGGTLGRTVEGALDVVVVAHSAHGTAKEGSIIVEIVKDRVGDALGQWAVWQTR